MLNHTFYAWLLSDSKEQLKQEAQTDVVATSYSEQDLVCITATNTEIYINLVCMHFRRWPEKKRSCAGILQLPPSNSTIEDLRF